jgi:hypothetical protein
MTADFRGRVVTALSVETDMIRVEILRVIPSRRSNPRSKMMEVFFAARRKCLFMMDAASTLNNSVHALIVPRFRMVRYEIIITVPQITRHGTVRVVKDIEKLKTHVGYISGIVRAESGKQEKPNPPTRLHAIGIFVQNTGRIIPASELTVFIRISNCFLPFLLSKLRFYLDLFPFPETAESTSFDNVRACFPGVKGENKNRRKPV